MNDSETQFSTRFVWVLAKPLRNPALEGSGLIFQYWGLLVSHLPDEQLEKEIAGVPEADALLGVLWEVLRTRQDKFMVKITTPFYTSQLSQDLLFMEYCGETRLSEDGIMEQCRTLPVKC